MCCQIESEEPYLRPVFLSKDRLLATKFRKLEEKMFERWANFTNFHKLINPEKILSPFIFPNMTQSAHKISILRGGGKRRISTSPACRFAVDRSRSPSTPLQRCLLREKKEI